MLHYLIELFILLFIAYLIGAFLGWLLRSMSGSGCTFGVRIT